jgi:phage-related protein/predicted XRE-type DNA-binding protein
MVRTASPLKPLEWIGSSKRDLLALPGEVVDVFGYALYLAQSGGKHAQAKVLHGFGAAGVLEVVENFRGNAYRAVYTVRFEEMVFVLHVFQKKSKSGVATPKPDMDLIWKRLQAAGLRAEELRMSKHKASEKIATYAGTGNIYADLGYPDADEMLVKAQLVSRIAEIIQRRELTQVEAAKVLGLTQPKVSAMLRGQFRGFSERKLMDCLISLGRDVEIVIKEAPQRRTGGKITVVVA